MNDPAHHRHRLDRAGVTLLRGALSPEQLTSLRDALAAIRASGRAASRQVLYTHGEAPPERPPLTAILDHWLGPHRYPPPLSTRPMVDALRPIAEALLGEPPVLLQDLLLVKRGAHTPLAWHQDFAFWPVDRPLGVVLWALLQACGVDDGALRFAPGSHRLGARPAVDLHVGGSQRPDVPLGFDPDAWPCFAPTYAAGDVAAFSPLVFHGSPVNHGARERAAWSCCFLSPRVRWRHASAPNHPLCARVVDGAPIEELTA